LATLKCANGDLTQLGRALQETIADYRDVLIRAEYLSNYKLTMKTKKSTPEAYNRSVREDWKQYNEWLTR